MDGAGNMDIFRSESTRRKIKAALEQFPDWRRLIGRTVLITGAGGLIGTAAGKFLMYLNQEYNAQISIIALGRSKEKLEERFYESKSALDFHILEGDVTCPLSEQIAPDFIIHAASPAHPLAYAQMPVEVMSANFTGTMRMLELARSTGGRVLFVSSGEIYGIGERENCEFQEKDQGYIDLLAPRSSYPESKRAAETLCASYYAQYKVEAVIARLGHVYGPTITTDNSRADAQFLRRAVCGKDIVMKSKGTQVRSYCYVLDAVMGFLYILLRGTPGEAYNVANRDSTASIHEYAETLARICAVRIQSDFPSAQEVNGYSRVQRAVLNAERLEALGWKAGFDLYAGLKETVSIMRSDLNLRRLPQSIPAIASV